MTDQSAEAEDSESGQDEESWDAEQVLKDRAKASRAERDAAIASLRASMSDEDIREDFGIDLGEIEG